MSEATAEQPAPERTLEALIAEHSALTAAAKAEMGALRRSLDAAKLSPGRLMTDVLLIEALNRIADVELVMLENGRAISRAATLRTFQQLRESWQAATAPEPEAPRHRVPRQAGGQRPLFPHAVRSLVPA
jgi:hypothetical protein